MQNYRERNFEDDVESYFLGNGFVQGDPATFDRKLSMDTEILTSFIKETQPTAWKRYCIGVGSTPEQSFCTALNNEILRDKVGMLNALRNGIKLRGIEFKLVYFKPKSHLNADSARLYQANIFMVTRQFKYSTTNENSIDIVLSLNGLPLVSFELKNQFTGQDFKNAEQQYILDRNPRENCFRFNNRFLVYFAVDLNNVSMTTKLEKEKTSFLPYNQGSNGPGVTGGAGNPNNPEGYAVSYLWEQVFTKASFLNIIQQYLHIVGKKGNTATYMIFPRYHQLDVVTKLISATKNCGTGTNYLVQHSAGSGKSNSIAWLSYQLAMLHDSNDKAIFNSVIIVTDRRVLNNQLQETINSFEHTEGFVCAIGKNKTSQDLKDAINDGKKIIVTTLQKFPIIYQDINNTKGKHYAVLCDEAHSSQQGESAAKLRQGLGDAAKALEEYAEIFDAGDPTDVIDTLMIKQGQQSNLSFYAFTATPKAKTLELFGTRQWDGSFKAFHIYSMRQAIEEGFILDVLAHYSTYKTCYKIVNETSMNPDVAESEASKLIKRFANLHEVNISQKTQIIVEHFRSVTMHKINGKAKAMVVTSSIEHAIRYYQAFKSYISKKGYTDVDTLIAFSGSKDIDGISYTEPGMNVDYKGDGSNISESRLPSRFHDDYNVLLVAEKYQTGFDEPLLHTMYVDKVLSDVAAVQTLSRLNRTYKGKTDTFVLDFVNSAEDIQKAFAPFFQETLLEEEVDVNKIFELQEKIRDMQVFEETVVDRFAALYFSAEKKPGEQGIAAQILQEPIDNFLTLNTEDKDLFKHYLKKFNKLYAFIIQITRLFNKELEKEYAFTRFLLRFLPGNDVEHMDLKDLLKLEYFKIKETFDGAISLGDEKGVVTPESATVTARQEEDKTPLDLIIEKINDQYDGEFNDGDKIVVGSILEACLRDEPMKEAARNNPQEMFVNAIFQNQFTSIAMECFSQNNEAYTKLLQDPKYFDAVKTKICNYVYAAANDTSMLMN